jgi:phage gpG-like protein
MNASTITVNLAGLDRLRAAVKSVAGMYARVGILGDKTARKDGEGGSNALIGAVHEFGSVSRHIPERSFLRAPMATHLKKEVDKSAPRIARAFADGTPEIAFAILGKKGEKVSKAAFDTSNDGKWPANAPDTISEKGSDRPLIDTGQLRRSISSDVQK